MLPTLPTENEILLKLHLATRRVCAHARRGSAIKYACTRRPQGQQCHRGLLPSVTKTLKCKCFIGTPWLCGRNSRCLLSPPQLCSRDLCAGNGAPRGARQESGWRRQRRVPDCQQHVAGKNKDATKMTDRDVNAHTFS